MTSNLQLAVLLFLILTSFLGNYACALHLRGRLEALERREAAKRRIAGREDWEARRTLGMN